MTQRRTTAWRAASHPPSPAGPAAQRGSADAMLRLQRSAGNRALGAVLARWPFRLPKKDFVSITDIGIIELEHMEAAPPGPPGNASSASVPEHAREHALHVASRAGDGDARLYVAYSSGEHLGTVTVTRHEHGRPYLRLTIDDAYISSMTYWSHGVPQLVQWTISGSNIEPERL